MTPYSAVGHVRLSDRGAMLDPDAGFCSLMGAAPQGLIGRSVLDVTAPTFRPACAGGMATLRATGDPFVVTKQMIRGDGTLLWVTQTSARSNLFDEPTVLATFVGIRVPETQRDPRALLANARFLAESGVERDRMFGNTLLCNPCWDLLLTAYIAEAEGRGADASALVASLALDRAVGLRWVRAMTAEGLLEVENEDAPTEERRYRLSAAAHDTFERFMTRRVTRLGGLGLSPVRWSRTDR